jgi:hypothetical protein
MSAMGALGLSSIVGDGLGRFSLSQKGISLVAKLTPLALALEASALEGMTAKEAQLLKQSLRRVFDNLVKIRSF